MLTPYFPQVNNPILNELAAQLSVSVVHLSTMLHPKTAHALANSLLPVKAAYALHLQGVDIKPHDIEIALSQQLSDSFIAGNHQIEALAYINSSSAVYKAMGRGTVNPASIEFLDTVYSNMQSHIPLHKPEISNTNLRTHEAESNWCKHLSPVLLQSLINQFSLVYKPSATSSLLAKPYAVASAHHRLAMLHPYSTGNQQVLLLFTEALCMAHGLWANGLWCLQRAIVNSKTEYQTQLRYAARPRFDSNDGKDALSLKSLTEYCRFFTKMLLNEVNFMIELLQANTMLSRFNQLVETLNLRPESMYLIKEVWFTGSLAKRDLQRITQKSKNIAADIANSLVDEGLLKSDNVSRNNSYYINIPAKHISALLPNL